MWLCFRDAFQIYQQLTELEIRCVVLLVSNGGMTLRNELIEVLGKRYRKVTPKGKSHILDEFVHVCGYHRKHAIQLLSTEKKPKLVQKSSRIHDEAVKEALAIVITEYINSQNAHISIGQHLAF